ncbi:hypothetical protein SASPL_143853 [Salvia splendens]|uniref:EF-hand domain-containing protein n=1 Tax=Salvia splendens TaxID=180675 RepID=A0A8X8WP51_SALSN|nr:hypothetical protein SASPL_143853 [Salvia splendens]
MNCKAPVVKLDDEQLAELREIFRSFDRNNDGSLTELELGSLLRSLGLKPGPDQIDALIQKADTNSNGLIEFSEFMSLVWEEAAALLAGYAGRRGRRYVVSHAWPTIKGWRSEALKQRQEAELNQFGSGRLEDKIDKEKYREKEEMRRVQGLNIAVDIYTTKPNVKNFDYFVRSEFRLLREIRISITSQVYLQNLIEEF